jgi:hypothetical protein
MPSYPWLHLLEPAELRPEYPPRCDPAENGERGNGLLAMNKVQHFIMVNGETIRPFAP